MPLHCSDSASRVLDRRDRLTEVDAFSAEDARRGSAEVPHWKQSTGELFLSFVR
jgi:hypothetical protein